MLASDSQNRSSLGSPHRFRRDSGSSPLPRLNPPRRTAGGEGRTQFDSSFERSGKIISTHQFYKTNVDESDDDKTRDEIFAHWMDEPTDEPTAAIRTFYLEGGAGGGVEADDRLILWPPVVVVLNTRLDKAEGSDKWFGMGNSELLDYFKEYEPVKARSAYGPAGHCGVSVLIFDSSVVGYNEAERLHKYFIKQGRGKYDWNNYRIYKNTFGKRLLYGYMPTEEEELRIFNKHYGDKQKLKFEMKSYQMMVGNPLKEMYKHIQKQSLLEREIAKTIEENKNLERTCNAIVEKFRQRDLEINAIRRRVGELSDEHNKEIESLNKCYDEEIQQLINNLEKSEFERENLLKAFSSMHSTSHDQHDAGLFDLPNLVDLTDKEHDEQHIEMDKIISEQVYLAEFDPEDRKQKMPLLPDQTKLLSQHAGLSLGKAKQIGIPNLKF